jgi:Helix-turn-helix domain
MSTPRSYGRAPKSTPRKATKHPWIRYEELMKRYLPLVGGTVWATYTTLFTYRNRKTNQCFPRYQTVAEARGVSRRTVIRHVNTLIGCGLIEKAPRFYDNDDRRERGGQRSNKYWFVSFSPACVTPGMSEMHPRTQSFSNQKDIKNLAEETTTSPEPCDHPWGEPLGYPHAGFWRCTKCGDLYKR